jgi:hypothetical protein
MSRQIRAKLAARLGDSARAHALAAETLSMSDGMQAPLTQGDACLDVAEALWLAGDRAEAARLAERAAQFYRAKGATLPEKRARRLAQTVATRPASGPPTTAEPT